MSNIEADLAELVDAANPKTILVIGPHSGTVFADYALRHPGCEHQHIAQGGWLRQLDTIGRYDLIFVAGVLEHVSKQKAAVLISRLRDLHTKRLYVLVPIGKAWLHHESHWEPNDMIAFGMELVNIYAEHALPLHLYKFDLHNYKATPEWFNSKYWAHPELWDKG